MGDLVTFIDSVVNTGRCHRWQYYWECKWDDTTVGRVTLCYNLENEEL